MSVIVTGAAGFIGFHVTKALLEAGHQVIGLDNLDPYYDPTLKLARLAQLGVERPSTALSDGHDGFRFATVDITDDEALRRACDGQDVSRIVHLAAQAGVRHSFDNPQAYLSSNLVGFGHVLELARLHRTSHFVYASSSSVYGGEDQLPYTTASRIDRPLSLYAATKGANELMAYAYARLYQLPMTGLRLFTVYGPWGRPDMAYFTFTRRILSGEPIDVFNHGNLSRDFTYVDDVIRGLTKVLDGPPTMDTEGVPHALYNLGLGQPIGLMDFIGAIEAALGKKANVNFVAMQPGDMAQTWADTEALRQDHDYSPSTSLEEGIAKFIDWYRTFYGV